MFRSPFKTFPKQLRFRKIKDLIYDYGFGVFLFYFFLESNNFDFIDESFYFNYYFHPDVASKDAPVAGWLSASLTRDSEANTTRFLSRRLIRKGSFLRADNALAASFRFLKLFEINYDYFFQLGRAVNNWLKMPYSVSSVVRAGRRQYFPVPLHPAAKYAYKRKILARILLKQHFRSGVSFVVSLAAELLLLISLNTLSLFFDLVNDYIVLGYDNRMFKHYRWKK